MSAVFIQHRVADFDTWKPLFDADHARRVETGLKDARVFRLDGDENMLLVAFQTDDLSSFAKMMADPELAAAMKEAGVISEPEVWIGEPAG
ncbi:MAG: hypothetical protein IIC92_00585 [Chloroflexi bacterium]|nr:hypothetical protein [Chloroflexota bacterium]